MSNTLAERVAQRAAAPSPARQAADDDAQPATLAQFVQRMRPEIERALPEHMSPDRIARIALTELRRVPNLAKCTQESFGGALMNCAQLGLEPGGAIGEAYLLPFWNKQIRQHEVQFVLGYQGMIRLFWQHPLAAGLDAHTVREGDEFDYEYGLDPFLKHKPARGQQGAVTGYYAVARMANGGSAFVVLDPSDVEATRQRSKAGDSGPWRTDYDAMARKTAVRQLFKLLPKSPQLARAVAHDGTVRRDIAADAFDAAPDFIEGELADQANAEAGTDAPENGAQTISAPAPRERAAA
ncbi:recombination protein RecT [Streptomyces sp. NPDC058989]|uniref:recombination protein RecT n=1 Tax=Streptomyces sp. NPDC058989 TaxID=3346686 RepID=UPI0036BCBB5C